MRFWTLFQLQWWDVRRNPLIILFAITVVLMGGMFTLMTPRMSDGALDTLSMLLVMSAYFVGWNVPTLGLSEEKEKRTLEALLLTPVRPVEIVLSRALLAGIMTLTVGVVQVIIFRHMPVQPVLLFAAYLMAMLFTISFGTLVGLISPDMKSTSSFGTPVLLVMMFATTLPWKQLAPSIWDAQAWLPTRPLVELVSAGATGEHVPLARDFLIMAGYTGVVLWFCIRQMRRFGAARR